MSVGLFMGIRWSYQGDAQELARSLIDAVNRALPPEHAYDDPEAPPDVYVEHRFGRSSLDHHGARTLMHLGEIAEGRTVSSAHIRLLAENPYRVAYLPVDFESPVETDHRERIGSESVPISVGSAFGLLRDLRALAPELGIPLTHGRLTDEVAAQIDSLEPLYEGDDCSLADDERTAWLLLYEGARLACKHEVALALAG